MLCFSIYVLIIYAFRGNFVSNLLIIYYGRIPWSQKVVCILYSMCGQVSVINCCVLCGLVFHYVVVLYTKRQHKHHVLEPVVLCVVWIHVVHNLIV